jgi:hypothetical protein
MILSSADTLILLLPILLWNAKTRWQGAARALALALLLLKPQVSFLLVLYLVWTLRRQPRALLFTLAPLLLITLPISLLGSPPLLVQWLDNILNPVNVNLDHWVYNNLSLTYRYGLPFALSVVVLAIGGMHWLMRRRGYHWTQDHIYAALFLASMLLAPYASNQSAIVPLILLPSWMVTGLQFVGVLGTAILNIYALADDWLVLIFTLTALWQYRTKAPLPAVEAAEKAQLVSSSD